ncbi:MAG: BTAD domain-containing putative transcriptional regulator [Ilumatobacter sp.]
MGDRSAEHPELRVVASGRLQIWVGDERVDTRIPIKAALMIAYLADVQIPVSRGTLAGLLWSDHTEERARSSLRVALTRSRQHVPHLGTDRSSVGLDGPVRIDLHAIEQGGPEGRSVEYAGEAFAGIEVDGAELFNEWMSTRRAEHRTLTIRSLGSRSRHAADEGHWSDVRSLSREMIQIEPWNELAHRQMISAQAVIEGRASALAAYERCAAILLDEFGVEPDRETADLAASIRSGSFAPPEQAHGKDGGATPRARSVSWRLLGDVAVSIDGVVHDLGGRHRRSVMAHLALRAPQRCSIEELSAAVWGDAAPATARRAVRRYVRELQSMSPELGERIEHVLDGYRLAALPHEVDAHDVRASIEAAQTKFRYGETEDAAAALRDAIERWDGASLGGVSRSDQMDAARSALDELRLGAIDDLIEAELALGRDREIAGEAEAFALEHPTRDRSWSNLMLVRFRTGRRSEAIDAYRRFCSSLDDEGLAPPQSIVALYRQIVDEAPAVYSALEASSGDGASWTLPSTSFSVPLPPAFDRSTVVKLAGRRREVSTLEAVLDDLAATGPRTVFVAGEPGIGKTRLVAEIAKTAHDAGAAVLYGRCDDSLGVPFQAWREALAHLADHVPPHVARRHLERFGPSLRMMIPSLAHTGIDDVSDAHGQLDDSSQQELLFRATADLLADVARRRRLVVVIDDMQWAHSSTLDLLRYLARHAQEPMVVIGLHRTTDLHDTHPLHDVVADLERADVAITMTLDNVDEAARTSIVREMVGAEFRELAPQIASKVATETGGNPFFFTEVVRSLCETGSVATILDPDVDPAIPPTVQRVVAQRVGRLGDDIAETLRIASVFGREFEIDALSLVLRIDEEAVLDQIELALSAGLVTDAPLGRDRFAFAHDLVHHTLAAQLSASRRSRVHARIADALEQIHGADLGDRVPAVATHLIAADDPTRRAQTVRRCRDAGRHSARRLAPVEAGAWFRRALDCLDPAEDSERASILVELGTQQRNAADAEHRTTLIDAGRLALARGDTETLVASTLANTRGMNAHVWELDADRIAMLRATLDAIGPTRSAERADLLASLANEQWDADHRAESEAYYREAMELAREVGDPATIARVLVRVSRARNFRLDRAELAEVSEELKRVAHSFELSDPLLFANCLTTVLNTSIRLGLARETREAIAAIHATSEQLPLPMFTLPAHLARCLDAGVRGDIQAYEQAATDTYHHATSIGDEEAGFIFEGQMYYTAYLRGDLAPILEFSVRVMVERPDVPLYRAVCTLIHTKAGKLAEAGSMLDTEVVTGIESSVDMFQIQALVAWADAAATLDHEDASEQLYDALIGLSNEMSGHLVQVGEPIDISLGRLATVLGRFDDAQRHFERAQVIAHGFEARWMSAQTAICRAEMLLRRKRPGDATEAREAARNALELAQASGYREIAAKAEMLLDAAVENPVSTQ